MDKLNGCIFLIEDDDLLEKYNTIWENLRKIPKVDPNHACLALISLDSTVKKIGNYYVQVFLVISHIHDNLSFFSSSSGQSDEE